MHRMLLTLAFSVIGATVFAQAPFPGAVQVDGGWVPCSHPLAIERGVGCEASVPGTADQFPWTRGTSPYTVPADSGLRFELGKMYREPYGGIVRIIGTVTLTDGEMVFVGECLSGIQSSCPKDHLLRFGLTQDRGAFHWEVSPDELPTFLP